MSQFGFNSACSQAASEGDFMSVQRSKVRSIGFGFANRPMRRLILTGLAALSISGFGVTLVGAQVTNANQSGADSKAAKAADSKPAKTTDSSPKSADAVTKPAVVAAKPAVVATKSIALTPISENSAPTGCGCFFYRPTEKRELGPLLFHMDGNGAATIKPEGQLVELKLIDEQHSRRDPNTISAQDRVLLKLRGGATNASVTGTAERNCVKPAPNGACSSVSYQTILNVDHQGKRMSQPAWGFCGCR